MSSSSAKIFGIGLSKTGTTSLARALEILGYRTRDYMGITRYESGDLNSVDLKEIEDNDAFTDTPIPSFYKELDKKFPNSKFILTTRDIDGWLKSCKKQFTKRMAEKENVATARLHTDLYGCFEFDREKYAEGYRRYTDDVMGYFRDRPDDLLVMDLCGGDKWERLCSFLGKAVPDTPYPVTNVSAIQWMDIQKIISTAKQAGNAINSMQTTDGTVPGGNVAGKLAARFRFRLASLLAKTGIREQPDCDPLVWNARRTSTRIILAGLNKMNPSIPAITPTSTDTPFSERMNWSHTWLVNPLDGDEAYLNHESGYTISIALTEGGKPVWGVVYDPFENTVYYAKGASGSYKIDGDNPPVKLPASEPSSTGNCTVLMSGCSGLLDDTEKNVRARYAECDIVSEGCTKAMCHVAEGTATRHVNLGPTREWDTAAAHAVMRAAGKHVRSYQTGEELAYNKEILTNASFVAE